MRSFAGTTASVHGRALGVRWTLGDGAILTLVANLGDAPASAPIVPEGEILYETAAGLGADAASAPLPQWSVIVCLER